MSIQTGITPQDDPMSGLFSDPDAQRKIADNVLSQLGLHPDQAGARTLLDDHLTGPTAHPDVQNLIAPITAPAPPAADTAASLPSIPGPGVNTRSILPTPRSNTHDQTLRDQAELARQVSTGSGISQIKNPFLRTLAHVGEAAETGLFPAFAAVTPGTQFHHNVGVSNQEDMVKQDIENEQKQAMTAHEDAATDEINNKPDKDPSELGTWIKQHPDKDISEYWKEKAVLTNGKLTPDEQLLRSLTTSVAEGGQGLSVEDAYKKLAEIKAQNKPATSSSNEQALEALLAKAMPNGQADPNLMSNPQALGQFISNSGELSDEEKGKLLAHFVFKTSPASQGGIADKRAGAILQSRQTPVIDTSTGKLGIANAAQINSHPGQYLPATQGTASMGKEAIFQDMHFNMNTLRDAYTNLQNGFTPAERAQIALMLRSPDPHSAMDAFFRSSIAQTLTPDKVDLVTALASMNENGMMMRSIQNIGQGSDQVRAAVMQLLPGAGSADKAYAKRQLDLLEGTINRIEQGVPKTGITHPNLPSAPKTGEAKFEYHDLKGNQTYTFKTQKQLDDFKKEAGIH